MRVYVSAADYNRHLPVTNQMPRAASPAGLAAGPTEGAAGAVVDVVDLPASYEAALSELDTLVQAMEGGQLPLDRLLEGYRRGAVLLDFCRERLASVETQVKVLEEGLQKPWTNA